jgi:hypothetical protein
MMGAGFYKQAGPTDLGNSSKSKSTSMIKRGAKARSNSQWAVLERARPLVGALPPPFLNWINDL